MLSYLVITCWSLLIKQFCFTLCTPYQISSNGCTVQIFILSICSALNPDCSFVFEWRNSLGVWKDTQIFVLWIVALFSYSSYYWRCDHPFWPCIEWWWWRSSVAALFSSCPPVSYEKGYVSFHFVVVTDKALSTVLVGRANGPFYCLLR